MKQSTTAQASTPLAKGWRRHGMAVFLLLLPLLMLVGLFAPQMVRVIEAADETAANQSPTVGYQARRLDKQPLLIPRDFSPGFVPELLDLHNLFSQFHYGPSDRQIARVLGFPRSYGDTIVLDDVDSQLGDVFFKDALAGAQVASNALYSPQPFLGLFNPTPTGNGLREDDFPGSGIPIEEVTVSSPVPEPGTGLLVGLGLAALALRRRAR